MRSELYFGSRISNDPFEALDLTAHVHLAAQEVDVADLQGGGLAES